MPVSEFGERRAILRVHGHGEILASDAAEFLGAIDDCYASLMAFDAIVTRVERWRPCATFLTTTILDYSGFSMRLRQLTFRADADFNCAQRP
jgi:hypothetical protein